MTTCGLPCILTTTVPHASLCLMMLQLFEGTVESGKEHKPPRAMPQLMDYFKAIKVRHAVSCIV